MSPLATILDWCFPPRPEELRVRTLDKDSLTLTPQTPNRYTVSLLPFAHPDVQACIYEAKYFYNQRAHWLLGHLTAAYCASHYPDATLVPIPLHSRRQRKRGFNQVTECLRRHPTLRTRVRTNLLHRHRYTASQTNLAATERVANVASAFRARNAAATQLSTAQTILLVDDVYTTGATLNAARSTLRAALPNHTIHCLTFAHA